MNLALHDAAHILTPALLLDVDALERNLDITLQRLSGNPDRWRPHVKTAKVLSTMQRMVARGIFHFKCATTLELATVSAAGARDVLLAFSAMGARARRVGEIAAQYPEVSISVLVESQEQLEPITNSAIGAFVDINPGLDRTGLDQAGAERVAGLVDAIQARGIRFRGLHYYDGQHRQLDLQKRQATAFAGYDQLMLLAARCLPEEVITSGTPTLPCAMAYPGFSGAGFVHRVSAGTVVYNDTSSLEQLSGWGYRPAVMVLASVISHPSPDRITCDAGHKTVSADAGDPVCSVWNHPTWIPLHPSEEHLPLQVPAGTAVPGLGDLLYLVPRHVCPTVNNFDHVLLVSGGKIVGMEPVTARGREAPLRENTSGQCGSRS